MKPGFSENAAAFFSGNMEYILEDGAMCAANHNWLLTMYTTLVVNKYVICQANR